MQATLTSKSATDILGAAKSTPRMSSETDSSSSLVDTSLALRRPSGPNDMEDHVVKPDTCNMFCYQAFYHRRQITPNRVLHRQPVRKRHAVACCSIDRCLQPLHHSAGKLSLQLAFFFGCRLHRHQRGRRWLHVRTIRPTALDVCYDYHRTACGCCACLGALQQQTQVLTIS